MDGQHAFVSGRDVTHMHAGAALGFWPLTIVWFVMMAAMMAPAVWPWVVAFHRFSGTTSAPCTGATALFAAGYLAAWLAYSLAASGAQLALEHAAVLQQSWTRAVIFLMAGLYQFAALKTACLTHCRNPLTYFLTRWRNGLAGGFRMGIHHGAFCVGCGWVLMATMLAVGATNLWWMGVLAALASIEQASSFGHRLRRPLGIALVAVAVATIAGK
jgi:predicted metal-binding membrane protein